jgi:hypothetical protein
MLNVKIVYFFPVKNVLKEQQNSIPNLTASSAGTAKVITPVNARVIPRFIGANKTANVGKTKENAPSQTVKPVSSHHASHMNTTTPKNQRTAVKAPFGSSTKKEPVLFSASSSK